MTHSETLTRTETRTEMADRPLNRAAGQWRQMVEPDDCAQLSTETLDAHVSVWSMVSDYSDVQFAFVPIIGFRHRNLVSRPVSGNHRRARLMELWQLVADDVSSGAVPPVGHLSGGSEARPQSPADDPVSALYAELSSVEDNRGTVQGEIEQRLVELRAAGAEEGLPWSDASEKDLREFLGAVRPATRPRLSLLDNGNLRAVWANDQGERVALEFCGNGASQYVFFARMKGSNNIHRAANRFDRLRQILDALNELNLLGLVTG